MKLLVVRWSENDAASYYVDKDSYSRAHEVPGCFVLNSYAGDYLFINDSRKVYLDNGVKTVETSVVNWAVIDANSVYPDWFIM